MKAFNIYPILEVEEDVLRKPAEPATVEEAIDTVLKLEQAMAGMQYCFGLAAPQIGIPKQVAIIRSEYYSVNLINPVVTRLEDEFLFKREGCMSYPGRKYNVQRFRLVEFETDTLWSHEQNYRKPDEADYIQGRPTRFIRRRAILIGDDDDHNSMMASVGVQHEMDHLAGLVLPYNPAAIEVERQPLVSTAPASKKAVGRNEPCPCGSGKKYKKCCGG